MENENRELIQRSKGGRREMVKGLKRIERLSLHLDKSDKEQFDSAYEHARRKRVVSRNTFAIDCILKGIKQKPIPVHIETEKAENTQSPEIDKQLYDALLIHLNSHKRDLQGIAVNLNQLVKKANSQNLSVKAKKEVDAKINELLPQINDIVARTVAFYKELDKLREG